MLNVYILFLPGPELASGWTDRRNVTPHNAVNASRSRLAAKAEALKAQVCHYTKLLKTFLHQLLKQCE